MSMHCFIYTLNKKHKHARLSFIFPNMTAGKSKKNVLTSTGKDFRMVVWENHLFDKSQTQCRSGRPTVGLQMSKKHRTF